MLFRKEDGLLAAADIAAANDPSLTWSQFIDNFRASDEATRRKIVRDEPANVPGADPAFAAFVAATVEALCNEVGMPPPQWVFHARFVLSEPAWGINNIKNPETLAAARALLRAESLPEFAARNLFYGANVLSRV